MKTMESNWKKQTVEEVESKFKEYQEIANWLGRNTYVNENVPVSHFFTVGKNYLIRTVTMIQIGRLIAVGNKEIVLEDAVWVADTGRFHEFVTKYKTSNMEIEPFPKGKIFVGRDSVIDMFEWNAEIPKDVV